MSHDAAIYNGGIHCPVAREKQAALDAYNKVLDFINGEKLTKQQEDKIWAKIGSGYYA